MWPIFSILYQKLSLRVKIDWSQSLDANIYWFYCLSVVVTILDTILTEVVIRFVIFVSFFLFGRNFFANLLYFLFFYYVFKSRSISRSYETVMWICIILIFKILLFLYHFFVHQCYLIIMRNIYNINMRIWWHNRSIGLWRTSIYL